MRWQGGRPACQHPTCLMPVRFRWIAPNERGITTYHWGCVDHRPPVALALTEVDDTVSPIGAQRG